jgi:hypothetical protein
MGNSNTMDLARAGLQPKNMAIAIEKCFKCVKQGKTAL